jgi:hypothetical protein
MRTCATSALAALIVTWAPVVLTAPESFEPKLQKLLAICAAHPRFEASSIDFFRPETSTAWEQAFYETAASMHSHTKEAWNFLLATRKTANDAQKHCIDSIINTWPG